jgi:hypothetical protein
MQTRIFMDFPWMIPQASGNLLLKTGAKWRQHRGWAEGCQYKASVRSFFIDKPFRQRLQAASTIAAAIFSRVET